VCTGRASRSINNILGAALLRVSNRIIELREAGVYDTYTPAQLRQMLTDMTLTAPTVGSATVDDYISKVTALKSGATKKRYVTLRSVLSRYCNVEGLLFTDLTLSWFEGWRAHLVAEGKKPNSIGGYLTTFKSVVRFAEEDGVHVPPAYKKVSSRQDGETALRVLPVETMRRIRDTPITNKMRAYRDAFMLSFYLIGINPADLLALPKGALVNGRINYRRKKTGKQFSVKVWPEAQAIIDRWPGKRLLLSFGETYRTFDRVGNRFFPRLEPGLTWYYARYSWANYAVDLDVPKDIISEALGHSHGSAVTGIYIRYSLDKVDEANRRVIDYLNEK
jgi:integrase